jgi:hypothetical protein
MPVTVIVDHDQRRVFARCTGVVTCADMERHLQIRERPGEITYSGLIDCRGCETNISVAEARSLAFQIHSQRAGVNRGPTAIVADDDVMYGMARLFATLTDVTSDGAGAPVGVFRDMHDAEQWLAQGSLTQ